MPETSKKLRGQLGLDEKDVSGYIPDEMVTLLQQGHKIGKPYPLFKKIEEKEVEALRNKYAGKQGTAKPQVCVNGDAKSIEAAIAKQVFCNVNLASQRPFI